MKLYFRDLKPYVIQMFRGLGLSISLTLVAMLVGSILGLLLYLGKSGRQTALKAMCSVYIEIMRNTPLLVQLYLIYFGLAQIGIDVSAFTATLVLCAGHDAGAGVPDCPAQAGAQERVSRADQSVHYAVPVFLCCVDYRAAGVDLRRHEHGIRNSQNI